MKFGESLRKERELRGLTLEDISQHTKVHPRFLEAIEHDDLSILPAKAFAKGFLRSYARMVGLDEDLVMINFEHYHRTAQAQASDAASNSVADAQKRETWLLAILLFVLLAAFVILFYQGVISLDWLF